MNIPSAVNLVDFMKNQIAGNGTHDSICALFLE